MNTKLQKIIKVIDSFDTSQSKATKILRYESYLLTLSLVFMFIFNFIIQTWLVFSFYPKELLVTSMPDIKNWLESYLKIYDIPTVTWDIIPYLWYVISFIATTIIVFKIKNFARSKIINFFNEESNKVNKP